MKKKSLAKKIQKANKKFYKNNKKNLKKIKKNNAKIKMKFKIFIIILTAILSKVFITVRSK